MNIATLQAHICVSGGRVLASVVDRHFLSRIRRHRPPPPARRTAQIEAFTRPPHRDFASSRQRASHSTSVAISICPHHGRFRVIS